MLGVRIALMFLTMVYFLFAIGCLFLGYLSWYGEGFKLFVIGGSFIIVLNIIVNSIAKLFDFEI